MFSHDIQALHFFSRTKGKILRQDKRCLVKKEIYLRNKYFMHCTV